MSVAETSCKLPRLLYLGDVPVEASYQGSALLYRLLEQYPADKLLIVEAGVVASVPSRRLAGICYEDCRPPLLHLQHTRFGPLYGTACLLLAQMQAPRLSRLMKAFRPDGILSVAHGHSWLMAATLARRTGVPLHLVCHDEWARSGTHHAFLAGWKDRIFGKNYRAATSRLCVSPFMAEDYEKRYGATGRVLFPSRSATATRFDKPPERLGRNGVFTCAFAGTVNTAGYAVALRQLADRLAPVGGRLLIFGPLGPTDAAASGLAAPNIQLGGMLPSQSLATALRKRADALFVPMSFAASDRPNMEISFPSKLTDYTAVGLPLLIYGPEYCAAVRWARANKGVAEVVTDEGGLELSEAIARLASDPTHRLRLAQNAQTIGDKLFSNGLAFQTFTSALVEETKPCRPQTTALSRDIRWHKPPSGDLDRRNLEVSPNERFN